MFYVVYLMADRAGVPFLMNKAGIFEIISYNKYILDYVYFFFSNSPQLLL